VSHNALGARRIALVTETAFRRDRFFATNDDPAAKPQNRLRSRLNEEGRILQTADIFADRGEEPDLVLFVNLPRRNVDAAIPRAWRRLPKFALLLEGEVINRWNWDSEARRPFVRLFTWSRRLVDNKRFFELNLPSLWCDPPPLDPAGERFCTLIAANKSSSHRLELYSERLRLIRWFEQHRPADFDLYGFGWDALTVSGPPVIRMFNRLPSSVRRRVAIRRPSYRGSVEKKTDVLGRYQFAVCYENARDLGGYVSEKIFDALLAGSIPIYLGAPDITDYVQPDCFVDRRDFSDDAALYDFLRSLSPERCEEMRMAGRQFLMAELTLQRFGADAWVETLLQHL
jgi:hypothetical protein